MLVEDLYTLLFNQGNNNLCVDRVVQDIFDKNISTGNQQSNFFWVTKWSYDEQKKSYWILTCTKH